MGKTGVIVGVIVLLAVAGGAFLLTTDSDDTSSSTAANSSASNSSETSENTDQAEASTTTISYTDSGFSPKTITVKVDSVVTVKNDSSSVLQFSSNPHPAHTDEDELNLSSLSPGKSTTFKVTRTGSFGFHNHLNEADTGTLVVE